MEKNIYELELHEILKIKGRNNLVVIRVAGGWIYRDERGDEVPVNTFVPFHNEFQKD